MSLTVYERREPVGETRANKKEKRQLYCVYQNNSNFEHIKSKVLRPHASGISGKEKKGEKSLI